MYDWAQVNTLPGGVWAWIRFSALIPALLAGGLGLSTQVLLGFPYEVAPVLALALGAFAVYQLDRLLSLKREDLITHPERTRWTVHRVNPLGVATAMAGLGAVMFGRPIAREQPVTVVTVGILSVAYGIALSRHRKRLKDLWWFKPILVAAVWAGVAGILVIPGDTLPARIILPFVLYRFLYLLTNVLLCELVEARSDACPAPDLVTELGERTVLLAARLAGLLAISVGIIVAFLLGNPLLALADVAGVLVLLMISRRRWLPRLRESATVDLATFWPVFVTAVALAAS